MRTWTLDEVDGGSWHQLRILVDGRSVAAIPFDNLEERTEAHAIYKFIVDACNAAEQGSDEYGSGRNLCFEDPLNNDMLAVDRLEFPRIS